MANKEQIALLTQSIEAWNQWRYSNRDMIVDLTHADLYHEDLTHADLDGTDLTGTVFNSVKLSKTNWIKAQCGYN